MARAQIAGICSNELCAEGRIPMTLTGFLHFIKALADTATIVTAGLVYLAWKQIKLVKEQSTSSFEDGLTEHYRRIMENIPVDIFLGSALESLDPELKNCCRDAIYRYIDLCQEQMFLHDKGRVTDATWIEWGAGIKSNMKIPAFKLVWDDVKVKLPDSFLELRKFLL
jgi:hypothetical protein